MDKRQLEEEKVVPDKIDNKIQKVEGKTMVFYFFKLLSIDNIIIIFRAGAK